MKLAPLLAFALLAGACGGGDTDGAGPTTSPTTLSTTSAPATTTTTIAPTTTAPTTTTTAPAEVDLINPVAGTLAGIPIGAGPVEPLIEAVTAVYGQPDQDTGWGPHECFPSPVVRFLFWDSVGVYLEEIEGTQTLLGYDLDGEAATAGEIIELPDGIELGMPYGEAAAAYPAGAYHHDSLELDGVILQDAPRLAVIAQASAEGSAPVEAVWVGVIPTCH